MNPQTACKRRHRGNKIQCIYVEFEVPTGIIVKYSIFWDITPCSPLKAS
jgi:hypothetical protein